MARASIAEELRMYKKVATIINVKLSSWEVMHVQKCIWSLNQWNIEANTVKPEGFILRWLFFFCRYYCSIFLRIGPKMQNFVLANSSIRGCQPFTISMYISQKKFLIAVHAKCFKPKIVPANNCHPKVLFKDCRSHWLKCLTCLDSSKMLLSLILLLPTVKGFQVWL